MTSDFYVADRKNMESLKGMSVLQLLKSALNLHPVLHLHLIGQKWIIWLSVAQSLEGGWEKEVCRGLSQPASSVCYRWVFVPEHIALRPWTQEPGN